MNRLQNHPKLKLTRLNHRYMNSDERPRISRPDLSSQIAGGALRKNDDPHMSGGAVQKNRKIKPLKF